MQKNNLLNEKDEYLKKINEVIDDSYTSQNTYSTRIWVEEYKTPSIEEINPETNEVTLNEFMFLSDRILDNIQANPEQIVGKNNINRLQMKSEQYAEDLYAFAASMKNEVDLDRENGIDTRSFLQFCTRIYDGNNLALNNLIDNGYFGTAYRPTDVNLEKFILSCANEVFKVNLLTPKDKDTADFKYSDLYSDFNKDIIKTDEINLNNNNNIDYKIDYSQYAEKERKRQRTQFNLDSYKDMYRMPIIKPFRHIVKESEKNINVEEIKTMTEKEFLGKDYQEPENFNFDDMEFENVDVEEPKLDRPNIDDIENENNIKIEEPNTEEIKIEEKPIPVKSHEEIKKEYEQEFEAPIILTDQQRINLMKQVNLFVKQVVKGQYDSQKNISGELKNTTESYAKGIKDAFEDFPNWNRLPEDARKDAAKVFKLNLDKNIDGQKQAAYSLNKFYENLHYDRSKINKNNPKHVEALENMKNDGLHIDALSSYFRLTEIHEKRNPTFWFFHPFQNKAEKAAIAEMKNVLKEDFKMTEDDLNPYRIDENGNKNLKCPKLGDEMINSIIGMFDENTAKNLVQDKQIRKEQASDYMKMAESKDGNFQRKENHTKFNIEDMYPELFDSKDLNKTAANKEKTVEMGKSK